MKYRYILLATLLSLFFSHANAQTLSKVCVKNGSNCPDVNSTNPLPIGVYGGNSGQVLTSNGAGSVATFQAGGSGGVSSINSVPGAFTFSGSGVSCSGTGCTFSGAAGGSVTIGTSLLATNPQITGDATSGFYTPAAGVVDLASNGKPIIWFPTNDSDKFGTIGIGTSTFSAIGTSSINNLDSTAVGFQALKGITTGTQNQAFGFNALVAVTTGINNDAFGWNAGANITTGTYNDVFGHDAGVGIGTSGIGNTAMGEGALDGNGSGNANVSANTAIGDSALFKTSNGDNTAVGYFALYNTGNTQNNTALGIQAGEANTTGANNLFLGTAVGSTTLATGSNNILIGTSSAVDTTGSASNYQLNIGNSLYGINIGSSSPASVGIGSSLPAANLDVVGTGRFSGNLTTNISAAGNVWSTTGGLLESTQNCQTSATTANWATSACAVITASGGNVTVTLSNPVNGGIYTLGLCNDGSARTWTLPGTVKQSVTPIYASECVYKTYTYDGTNYQGMGSSATPTVIYGVERTAPAASASGAFVCWWDSTNHVMTCNDNASASNDVMVVPSTVVAGQFLTGIGSTGVITQAALTTDSTIVNTAGSYGRAALTGDATSSAGSNATAVVKVNGAVVPTSATAVASNGSNQLIAATYQGNGAKVQLSTGTTTTNDCVKFDANGNTVDNGSACGSGGAGGGGTFNYSDNGVTVTAGTYFVPIGGGGIPQATEAAVSVAAPAATTVSNLQVNLSTAPGAGQTLAVTLQDGGSAKAVTCTISTAATTCSDLTHSFNVSAGDLIDWKIVTTGTYVSTPTITITAANGTSNVGTTSVTGTANQIDVATGTTTPVISLDSALQVPGSLTVTAAGAAPAGSFVNQIFTPILNTSDSTDQLTGNGSLQFFSMNSNAATIPANTITSGKWFSLYFTMDIITGSSATSNYIFQPSLCAVAGCGSGTVVKLITTPANPGGSTNTTNGSGLTMHCAGTAAAGASTTIICAPEGRVMGSINTSSASAIITGVPTNATLYVNMGVNQTTQTGNKVSMVSARGDWDTK